MAPEYPPPQHLYRDIHLAVDQRADLPIVRVPVVPHLLGPGGGVRTGVLCVALDVFGGNLAVEAAAPDWALTAQLELHVLRPLTTGTITVTGRPLRAGKTNLVAEAWIRAGDGDGPASAAGRLTFTRVPTRGGEPPRARRGGLLYEFAEGAEELRVPFPEAVGLRVRDAATGDVEIALVPYVHNSVGALQGGMVVALAEASAEHAGRALFGGDAVTTDISLHFLALGKQGPIRSRATLLRRDADSALFSVSLHDAGQDDRLASVATARVAPALRGSGTRGRTPAP